MINKLKKMPNKKTYIYIFVLNKFVNFSEYIQVFKEFSCTVKNTVLKKN